MKLIGLHLKKAEHFAKKYNKNILIFFYRPGCDYCENMKKETLSDPLVIKKINEKLLSRLCLMENQRNL